MANLSKNSSTIAACASGRTISGVAVVRISGELSWYIAKKITNKALTANRVLFAIARDKNQEYIDQVLVIGFRAPASFTGEDVVEIHCHGNPIIVDLLLENIFQYGAVPASQGEFSKRAFLNGKIDLTQAEAIADIIGAGSIKSARYAANSLQGAFSKYINDIVAELIQLRVNIEASIDFPDEETGEEDISGWVKKVNLLLDNISNIHAKGTTNLLASKNINVVIIGAPNSGKSSLFNSLLENDRAIVTSQAGTTRDLLKEQVQIGRLSISLTDTAGLHATDNMVESIGIEKAQKEARLSDHILYLYDPLNNKPDNGLIESLIQDEKPQERLTIISTKADVYDSQIKASYYKSGKHKLIHMNISSHARLGINELKDYLEKSLSEEQTEENTFSVRQRHLASLKQAENKLNQVHNNFINNMPLEIIAHELLEVQNTLGEITGIVTSDKLLGEIFSSFCIGK